MSARTRSSFVLALSSSNDSSADYLYDEQDRLLQLLQRGREYVQLSRDSTTQSLLQAVALEGGVLKHLETPLLRAIRVRLPLIAMRFEVSSRIAPYSLVG